MRAPPVGAGLSGPGAPTIITPGCGRAKRNQGARRMAGEGTIGFIGVGRMGLPMASRLIDAGHRLVAYDTQGQALSAIANKGAEKAASPAEVASRADVVMASLPRPEIVREVAL